MIPNLHVTMDSNRCILSGNVVIGGIVHRVSAKFVVCDPRLNHRAWSVTEPLSACTKCFPPNTQLSLF